MHDVAEGQRGLRAGGYMKHVCKLVFEWARLESFYGRSTEAKLVSDWLLGRRADKFTEPRMNRNG